MAAAAVLRADPASLDVLTAALGYHAVYDSEHDQFAHPSAALALAPDGRIVRVLSSLALDPQDLRLALTEAGEGRIGGVGDRLILMCYGFDPVHGIYTPLVHRILAAGGVLTLGLLGLALFVLHRRSSKPLEGARS
jgi:protein SCO1/2